MGRPERKDADYFPFYCRDGKTLFILESKYQCKGTGFFTNVMRFLTLQKDHHICISDETDRAYFIAKTKCDEEAAIDMLNLMSITGKIDREMWVSYQVIISQDLLDSLKEAYKNRKNTIITIDDLRVSYHGKGISYPEKVITYPEKPQRKEKERKGKEKNKYTDEFLKFYEAYPNKKDRTEAWRYWHKLNSELPPLQILLDAIQKQKDWRDRAGPNDFRPPWKHPATWLNRGCWDDDCEVKNETRRDAPGSNRIPEYKGTETPVASPEDRERGKQVLEQIRKRLETHPP